MGGYKELHLALEKSLTVTGRSLVSYSFACPRKWNMTNDYILISQQSGLCHFRAVMKHCFWITVPDWTDSVYLKWKGVSGSVAGRPNPVGILTWSVNKGGMWRWVHARWLDEDKLALRLAAMPLLGGWTARHEDSHACHAWILISWYVTAQRNHLM